jgi:hypothetical protein
MLGPHWNPWLNQVRQGEQREKPVSGSTPASSILKKSQIIVKHKWVDRPAISDICMVFMLLKKKATNAP